MLLKWFFRSQPGGLILLVMLTHLCSSGGSAGAGEHGMASFTCLTLASVQCWGSGGDQTICLLWLGRLARFIHCEVVTRFPRAKGSQSAAHTFQASPLLMSCWAKASHKAKTSFKRWRNKPHFLMSGVQSYLAVRCAGRNEKHMWPWL